MTPEMCQILYQLSVTVIQRPSSIGPGFQLATKSNIKVIPSMDYYPIPEEIDAPRYIMQLGKDVKRGLLNGKSGRLALSSTIPNPIQLDLHQFTAANDLSTTATVSLRFDPESHQLPPQLERMNTKLRAHTFFATVPWSDFPHLSDERKYPRHEFGEYTESMRLSTRSIPSVQWEQCSASDSTSKNTSYTASIIVPITLPKSKAFAPTFHSCLVSRIYSLDITLSYCTSTSTILPTTLLLRVPLLISCQPRVEYLEMLPKSPILQLDLDEPHDSTGDTPPEYA
jgi:hypothetical protein